MNKGKKNADSERFSLGTTVPRWILRGSQRRGGGQRLVLRRALGFQQLGEQEREVDRLLGIEAGGAERVIAVVELGVGDRPRAAGAFGHVLAGHLQVHAAPIGAPGRIRGKETLHFLKNDIEPTGLLAGGGKDGGAGT